MSRAQPGAEAFAHLKSTFAISGLLLLLLGTAAACSGNNKQEGDAGPPGDALVGEGGLVDKGPAPDLPKPDAGKKPTIIQMIPSDGFSNGGRNGTGTPVTVVGESFAQGAMVLIESGVNGAIYPTTVTSAASLSFTMPKNPYGPPYTPYKASVQLSIGGVLSNVVFFQYTVSKDMDESFKGSIMTTSISAYAGYKSDPVEGRVYVANVTDVTTGESNKILVEAGLGKTGDDPSLDPGWRWYPATFSKDDGDYDVYTARLKAPLYQSYDMAFRFSQDGGQTWVYADSDETDLKYDPAQAAKLTATQAPAGYCQENGDCILSAYEVICKLDPGDWTKHRCVECVSTADCAAHPKALGPTCDTSKNYCYCSEDSECADNLNGAKCISSGKFCGCSSTANCPAGSQCVETAEGLTVCQ